MVNHCANPHCCKPLHYLREGRIFMFAVPDPSLGPNNGKEARRLEHFWLCGGCSEVFSLEQASDLSVRITPKPMRHRHAPTPVLPSAIAS